MDQLGKFTATAISNLTSRGSLPAPSTSRAVKPSILDREADYEIPARVWSNWVPAIGPREIRRALLSRERSALARRSAELVGGLIAFTTDERRGVDATLSAMLGGFRSMRQRGDEVEGIVQVLLCVLREFPAWAIQEGCRRIAMNEAGLDPTWPPNDAQIHAIVASIVEPYRRALLSADGLLSAPVEQPEQVWEPTKEQIEAKLGHPLVPRQPAQNPEPGPKHDGKHAQRVAAELEARRARRQEHAA